MKMYLPPPGTKTSRRSFLQKGLVGSTLLAAGGFGFLALKSSADIAVPPEGLLALSPREFAVVHTLATHFIPVRQNFPSVEEVRVAFNADRILTQVDETALAELKQALMLFENALANFLFGRRTMPFTQLPFDEQEAVLHEWAHSSLSLRRSAFLALRGLIVAAYYGSSKTWPAVGYPGPPAGIHDPNAPLWAGGDAPRPVGLGTFTEAQPQGTP